MNWYNFFSIIIFKRSNYKIHIQICNRNIYTNYYLFYIFSFLFQCNINLFICFNNKHTNSIINFQYLF